MANKKKTKNEEVTEEKVEEVKKDTEKKTTKKTNKPKKNTKKKQKSEKIIENMTNSGDNKPTMAKDRDMNELIKVINISNSPLIYVSKSQVGYRIEWEGYLSENWMEYKELVNMRNSQRSFFKEPWIICEWDVLTSLRVDSNYKNIIDLENLDKIFNQNPKDLEKTLKIVPDGIKKLIVDRAFELRREKKLDSLNTIETIQKIYDIDLTV